MDDMQSLWSDYGASNVAWRTLDAIRSRRKAQWESGLSDLAKLAEQSGCTEHEAFADMIREVCLDVQELLIEKNRKYGNSALNPVRIFSRADPVEAINVRMDDKLGRIKNRQTDDDEDPEMDLLGYLVLKQVARRLEAPA